MKPKQFAIVNLSGCVILTLCLVFQWLDNSRLEKTLADTYKELNAMTADRDAKAVRTGLLEADLVRMKDSVESLNREVASVQKDLAARTGEVSSMATEMEASRQALAEWQKGVEDRDLRIAELEKTLELARSRLNEAVSRLRKAAAERRTQPKR